MKAKVGHFQPSGFHEIASGSVDYCRGFLHGYNLHSDVDAVLLVGDHCECGPLRKEVIQPACSMFYERKGCSRCNRWDRPRTLRKALPHRHP